MLKRVTIGKNRLRINYKDMKTLKKYLRDESIYINLNGHTSIINDRVTIENGVVIDINFIIGDSVTIKQNATIKDNVILSSNCEVGADSIIDRLVTIPRSCKIRDNSYIKKIVSFSNAYRYNASTFIDVNTGTRYIQLGCYTRTLEEWENDFWNNEIEFPVKDKNKSGKQRLEVYEFLKNIPYNILVK